MLDPDPGKPIVPTTEGRDSDDARMIRFVNRLSDHVQRLLLRGHYPFLPPCLPPVRPALPEQRAGPGLSGARRTRGNLALGEVADRKPTRSAVPMSMLDLASGRGEDGGGPYPYMHPRGQVQRRLYTVNELAATLKRLRAERKVTQLAVAKSLNVSKSLIASFEQGRLIPQEDTAKKLDGLFRSGETIQKLSADAQHEQQQQPSWFRPWSEVEREAVAIRWHETSLIPGLLQSKAYARMIFDSGLLTSEQTQEYLALRLSRQAIVFDRPDPPICQFTIDEAALRRGYPDVMREQLLHLVEIGQRPRVLIHVIPEKAGPYLGQSGGFILADMGGGHRAAYIDDQLEGRLITAANQVGALERAWQAITGVALPRDQSRDLILKMVDDL